MSSFVRDGISKALGVEQEHDDDDINTPLVGTPSKVRRDYSAQGGIATRPKPTVHRRIFSVCLVIFAGVFMCICVSVATLGMAETAEIADGKGGFTVLHNIHKQKDDWGKTKAGVNADR
eukprot:CAMPEP_0173467556 /NCGR_PEP_ID=MMETSP1357-20121228/75267_1 /TAXON_ID=77926 /ORGANISM="Hemiselmis rufescens, Strain PCC563" /LENGTH=118 /DNA_ID=CAMNT_0014435701 /DNA_START=144 /DNA_END=497 /DNA_ORIENTATION=+